MKTCIVDGCNLEVTANRRYCRFHYLQRHREQSRKNYNKGRYTTYKGICMLCNKAFYGFRKDQLFCSRSCYLKANRLTSMNASNNYEPAGGGGYCFKHRKLAEQKLNRALTYNEIVHHLDGNATNNEYSNLIVLSRSDHTKLHAFLIRYKINVLKEHLSDISEKWNNQIITVSLVWLESSNIKYIRLSDINA